MTCLGSYSFVNHSLLSHNPSTPSLVVKGPHSGRVLGPKLYDASTEHKLNWSKTSFIKPEGVNIPFGGFMVASFSWQPQSECSGFYLSEGLFAFSLYNDTEALS